MLRTIKLAFLTLTVWSLTSLVSSLPVAADTTSRLDSIEIPVPLPPDSIPDICSESIKPVINQIIERPELNHGKWAILVQSLGGTNIYSLNPDSYMIPASNMKLLVTAAALQKLDINGQIRSTSISDWIKITNLKSDNAYANVLLRYLGGFESVQQALTGLGVDSNGYRLRDGSGLSRNNLATPRTLVSTLRAMFNAKNHDIFFASLPVAGISGTLKNRLRHTLSEGVVHAKTGTLKGVKALSGYVEHPKYGILVFSIITNQPTTQPSEPVIQGIDDIVLSLSTLGNCR
jgi:serine-type D-Ala-D-Ala carboxypeptidase/endopeptidase (penicillin-binding protein 4)